MKEEVPPPKDLSDYIADGGQFAPVGKVMANGTGNGGGNVISLRKNAASIEWRLGREVFLPLPPTPWVSKELQIGPGRPAMLAGYGASAKTMAAQSLILSVAAGVPVWGKFHCQRGVAKHLDYEQGFKATARRYQRLARGMGIDPREIVNNLFVAPFPTCYLNSTSALDVYAKACEGASLVVIDSLRGALPGEDENASGIRSFVDVLTQVSERTGATVLLLHHAGKPKEGQTDARMMLRGSSALFDAAGCVLVVTNPKRKEEPRLVQQAKPPADAEAQGVDDFGLRIEDVLDEAGSPTGVRVSHTELVVHEAPKPAEKFERNAETLLEVVRANQGCSQDFLRTHAGIRAGDVNRVLRVLVEQGRLVVLHSGQNGRTQSYRTGEGGAS
jgi:hypothetical protein